MDKSCASRRSALLIAAVVALALGAQLAHADGWRYGEPGRWVPGTPMTDSQDVSDWSGFYVGGRLGGAWSDVSWTENFSEFNAPGGASFSPSSFAGGVIWGGNLQMGNWVFGLEGGVPRHGSQRNGGQPGVAGGHLHHRDRLAADGRSRASAIRGTARWCS